MRFLLLAASLFAIGCTTSPATPTDDRQQGSAEPKKVDDLALRTKLLEIAANYKKYEKADGRMRVAPTFCVPAAPPTAIAGAEYRMSRSDDEATHGKKLYTLYAAKIDPFTRDYTQETLAGKKRPLTDQVLVKESWIAEEVKPMTPDLPAAVVTENDGKKYRPALPGPLFVMYQTDPKDPNSDEGWVYGTLTSDGKTVTGVGRLANCMSCHQKAPHGRLFGLPKE